MIRRPTLFTPFAAAVFFILAATSVHAQVSLTMAPGEEREVCTGAKAEVTPPPKYGELRTGDSKDGKVHILYKAKDTPTAGNDNLTCTADGKATTVTIAVTPPKRSATSNFSEEAYPEAFKALFLLFVLAVVLESALAILFNWRPFVETFNARAVRPVVSMVFSLIVVYMFKIDIVTALAKLITPSVPALDHTGRILTAMVIAGGSAGVNNLMVALGVRQARTPETVTPRPPANKGWISVSIVRTANIEGPVTVAIGVKNAANQVPVVASLEGSTRPGYRYFLRDRGRFPGSGGYAVAKGDNVTVEVRALDKAKAEVVQTWGPSIIADGAIIDLTFTM